MPLSEAEIILNYNRKKLYKLKDLKHKYPCLRKALTPELYQFLLDVIAFWLSREKSLNTVYDKHYYTYFLGTQKGTVDVRARTTQGVTNRYISYLCALGLLEKNHQIIRYKPNRRILNRCITKVNANFLKYKTETYGKQFANLHPINSFLVIPYTPEYLDVCEQRAAALLQQNITQGNISYNMLAVNDLEDLAVTVYGKHRPYSTAKKYKQFAILKTCMNDLASEKGYTTKAEIYQSVNNYLSDDCKPLSERDLKILFRIFKNHIARVWIYKPAAAEERRRYDYHENRWIYIKR